MQDVFNSVMYLGFIPLLCLVGILGNGLLLVTLSKNNVFGHTYYNFLSAISALDLAAILCTVPIFVSRCVVCDFELAHITGVFMVFIMVGIQKIFIVSSCWTVLFLAFDLCLHTFRRRQESLFSKLRVSSPWLLIFLISMMSIVESLPTFWYYKLDGGSKRLQAREDRNTVFFTYKWTDITLTGTLYLFVLCFVNAFLVWRCARRMGATSPTTVFDKLLCCCAEGNTNRIHPQWATDTSQQRQHQQPPYRNVPETRQPKQTCCVVQQSCSRTSSIPFININNDLHAPVNACNVQSSIKHCDPKPSTSTHYNQYASTSTMCNPQPSTSTRYNPNSPTSENHNPQSSSTTASSGDPKVTTNPHHNLQGTDDPQHFHQGNAKPSASLPHPKEHTMTKTTTHDSSPKPNPSQTAYESTIKNLAQNALTMFDPDKEFTHRTPTGTGSERNRPDTNTLENPAYTADDNSDTSSIDTNPAMPFNPTKLHMYYSRGHFRIAVKTVTVMTILKLLTLGPGVVLQSITIQKGTDPDTLSLYQSTTTFLVVVCNSGNILIHVIFNKDLRQACAKTLARYCKCQGKVHSRDGLGLPALHDHHQHPQQTSAAGSVLSFTSNRAVVFQHNHQQHQHNSHQHHLTSMVSDTSTTGLSSPRDTIRFFREHAEMHQQQHHQSPSHSNT